MRESRIMQMDWKDLGYEREYKNGKLRWVPAQIKKEDKNESR